MIIGTDSMTQFDTGRYILRYWKKKKNQMIKINFFSENFVTNFEL